MNKWRSAKSAFIKRILACTLALGLCIGGGFLSPFSSDAADKLDLDHACSLKAIATSSTDKDFLADVAKADVVVDIYKIADAEKKTGYDYYTFKVADAYKDKVKIPDVTDSKVWSDLAQVAAGIVKDSLKTTTPITPDVTEKAGTNITGLKGGLYLVLARGSAVTDYFDETETTVTDANGNTTTKKDIVTVAYGDANVYKFAPEFVALPTKAPDPVTGEINTAANTDWLYSATISLKPSWEPRYGKLKIIKDLLTYEKSEDTFFIFSVDAKKKVGDEIKTVFSNVYTLKFSNTGKEELIIDKLPAGCEVTVTENYTGCNYKLVSDATKQVVILADDLVSVTFVNDYEHRDKHCGAITNHFDPVLDANGNVVLDENGLPKYTWSKYTDSREETN